MVKANGELTRLMTEYEYLGVEVLEAPSRADISTWLANYRPRRRATIPPSPGTQLTQSTDASNTSQQSGDCVLSDDYTCSEESLCGVETVEERSVNTETGLPDTQLTDETFSPEEKKIRKKDKRLKKERKALKKDDRREEDKGVSDVSDDSTTISTPGVFSWNMLS